MTNLKNHCPLVDAQWCFCSVKSLGQSLPGSLANLTFPISLWLPQKTLVTPSQQLVANTVATARGPLHNRYWNTSQKKEGGLQLSSIINTLRHSISFIIFKKGFVQCYTTQLIYQTLKRHLTHAEKHQLISLFHIMGQPSFPKAYKDNLHQFLSILYLETLAQVFHTKFH